jgi:uncharacterized protein (TIGR03382 family)
MRLFPAVTTAALLLLGASSAHATSNFPAAVQAKLALTYTPQCSLCHLNGVTGRGTVTTPFGKAMIARGAIASDETALNAALDKMIADKVDSDGNGETDIDALKAGHDPNGSTGGALFGCNAAGGSGEGSLAALLVAGALVLVGRRRRAT